MASKRDRKGLAIFLVVMITAIIGVFVAILVFANSNSKTGVAIKLEKAQATYLAQGAHQHFLLKFKLLPTELYDAVSYAVGKNPYFDFSAKMKGASSESNSFELRNGRKADRGPMFFTGSTLTQVSTDEGSLRVDRSKEGDNLYLNPRAGFDMGIDKTRPMMEFLLNHYLLDISTGFPNSNIDESIVVCSSEEHTERARMGKGDDAQGEPEKWRDPFNGDYSVLEIKVLGIGGATSGRKYQADSVLLTTEASVERENQISLVTRAGDGPVKLQAIRVTDTKLETSEGGEWVNASEGKSDYALKQKGYRGDANASARRTDIATGVYYISRKAK